VLVIVTHVAAAKPADKPTPMHARALTDPRLAAHPRAHARTRSPVHTPPNRTVGFLNLATSHARARAEPAGVGHPSHAAGDTVSHAASQILAKGPTFPCQLIRFVNPSFALGQVAQHPLAFAAGEVSTGRCPFGALFRAPSADRGWRFSPLHSWGHTRVFLRPIQSDPVRPATQGRVTPAPALRQAAGRHPLIRCAAPRHPPLQQPRGLQLA
jgi:hypothetical protein